MRLFIVLSLIVFNFTVQAAWRGRNKRWYVPTVEQALYRAGDAANRIVKKKTIKVVVWNAHKEGYHASWQNDFVTLAVNADFILLQEAVRRVGQQLPGIFGEFETIVGESFWYKQMKCGNMTLAHYRAKSALLLHSVVREPFIKTPKPALITDYLLATGGNLRIVNIHAINFVSLKKFKQHIMQITNILQKYKGVLIWAGDFNTWSKRRTRFLLKNMARLGLKQVHFRHLERGKKFFGHLLDYFFVRGAKVISADFPLVHTSDHNAMLVELEL